MEWNQQTKNNETECTMKFYYELAKAGMNESCGKKAASMNCLINEAERKNC